MSASEHADRARSYLAHAQLEGPVADRELARAQVEATLAVAEALLELKDEGLVTRTKHYGIG